MEYITSSGMSLAMEGMKKYIDKKDYPIHTLEWLVENYPDECKIAKSGNQNYCMIILDMSGKFKKIPDGLIVLSNISNLHVYYYDIELNTIVANAMISNISYINISSFKPNDNIKQIYYASAHCYGSIRYQDNTQRASNYFFLNRQEAKILYSPLSNLTQIISEESTEEQYPSAKATYNTIKAAKTLGLTEKASNQVVSISTVDESGVPTSYSTISPITDAALEDMLTETLGSYTIKQNASTLILNSSTQDSTKQFEITIDDTGTITAQEL